MIKKLKNYFSTAEITLWVCSASVITAAFCVFGKGEVMTFIASLIGSTAILFNAKGNPIGQLLMIIFSILYGIISYNFSYYGEMITYLGMTMPMAIISLVSWFKNPYKGNRAEVKVNSINKKEIVVMSGLTAIITAAFYFILKHFNTANLIPATISVATSFSAVYLTFKRSPHFSVAYAANDVILIILWSLASITDTRYISVTICFATFFANDVYCFIGWQKLKKHQQNDL